MRENLIVGHGSGTPLDGAVMKSVMKRGCVRISLAHREQQPRLGPPGANQLR
jgi:hypothetical protein